MRVLPVVASYWAAASQAQMSGFHGTKLEFARMFLVRERRSVMRICPNNRVFTMPAANDSLGWRRRNSRYDRAPKSRSDKISIAWWLVPCVILYTAVSTLVFG